MEYFSEREEGERPRGNDQIGEISWGGIRALIRARIEDGSFGASYPETCPDGGGPVGTDESGFWNAVRAEIDGFEERPWYGPAGEPPRTLDILDLVEFCWRCIGKPERRSYHDYFRHYHLTYDIDAGRAEFAEAINRIFRRGGLAYELKADGRIERLAPPVLREALGAAVFRTGDGQLDRLLETARRKFLDPGETVRRESLEALWDAWERLKTLGAGADKKAQVQELLDSAAGPSSPRLREALEREAKELTWIGNNLRIRHAETGQESLARSVQVDYLFHRLFALMLLILRERGRH